MDTLPLLFVYGTLRAAHHNHGLLAGATPIGLARTVAPRVMLARGIPYLHRSTHSIDGWGVKKEAPRVWGEVYQLPWDQLARVDRLEGHPQWYTRLLEPVELEAAHPLGVHTLLPAASMEMQGKRLQAWVYFITDHGEPVEITDGLAGPVADFTTYMEQGG